MVLLAPSVSNNRNFFRYRSPNGSADSRVEAQGIWPSNRVQFRSMEAMISCSHGHFSRTFWRPKRSEEARSLGRPENFQESWFSSIPASPPRQTHTQNTGAIWDQKLTNRPINQSINQSINQAIKQAHFTNKSINPIFSVNQIGASFVFKIHRTLNTPSESLEVLKIPISPVGKPDAILCWGISCMDVMFSVMSYWMKMRQGVCLKVVWPHNVFC